MRNRYDEYDKDDGSILRFCVGALDPRPIAPSESRPPDRIASGFLIKRTLVGLGGEGGCGG